MKIQSFITRNSRDTVAATLLVSDADATVKLFAGASHSASCHSLVVLAVCLLRLHHSLYEF